MRFTPRLCLPEGEGADRAGEITAYAKKHARTSRRITTPTRRHLPHGRALHARHILVKVDRNASADKKAEAQKKAEALRAEVTGGKDFAEVAKASSDDPGSKSQGGDLGAQEVGAWVPEFSKAAFALKDKEISQPVLTPFGYHIIQVLDRKAAEDRHGRPSAAPRSPRCFSRRSAPRIWLKKQAERRWRRSRRARTWKDALPFASKRNRRGR